MKITFVIATLFAAAAIAAPCGHKSVPADVTDVTDTSDLTSVPDATDSDFQDEQKVSSPVANKDTEDTQTAVINNNSPDHSGKGGLVSVSADNILANGVLSKTQNTIKQKND